MIVQPNPAASVLAAKNITQGETGRDRARIEQDTSSRTDLRLDEARETARSDEVSKVRPTDAPDVLNATVASSSDSAEIAPQPRGSLLDVVA